MDANTDGFFRDLPSFSDPRGVCEAANYRPVPADWVVVLTDVRGSTGAIEAGRYRDVNLVGAASIVAVLNVAGRIDVPYVFGGDGASLIVPRSRLDEIRRALLQVRAMSQREFGLELRVGAVAVDELRRAGADLEVARYRLAQDVYLAMFRGGGLALAEQLIKGSEAGRYVFEGEIDGAADCEGLQCRWQPIASTRGEIISVLVKATAAGAEAARVYREVIEEIEAIAGRERGLSPVHGDRLKVSLDPTRLRGEVRLHAGARPRLQRWLGLVRLWLLVLMGAVLFRRRMRAFGVDFGRYLDEVEANSDFWKYDDMLRFVIDVTAAERRALEACLEAHQRAGELAYGLHASAEALMTCLVFDMVGHHVHFIDGGDGGYALAAKQLKGVLHDRGGRGGAIS